MLSEDICVAVVSREALGDVGKKASTAETILGSDLSKTVSVKLASARFMPLTCTVLGGLREKAWPCQRLSSVADRKHFICLNPRSELLAPIHMIVPGE